MEVVPWEGALESTKKVKSDSSYNVNPHILTIFAQMCVFGRLTASFDYYRSKSCAQLPLNLKSLMKNNEANKIILTTSLFTIIGFKFNNS